jgi:hypothetical protein
VSRSLGGVFGGIRVVGSAGSSSSSVVSQSSVKGSVSGVSVSGIVGKVEMSVVSVGVFGRSLWKSLVGSYLQKLTLGMGSAGGACDGAGLGPSALEAADRIANGMGSSAGKLLYLLVLVDSLA